MEFHYVYILQSELGPERFYVGLTDDLHARLRKHNNGGVPQTENIVLGKLRPRLPLQTNNVPPISSVI
jgi:hypothetical protein